MWIEIDPETGEEVAVEDAAEAVDVEGDSEIVVTSKDSDR